jgi:archaellum biogenesis protein FlaJ (TadC family)
MAPLETPRPASQGPEPTTLPEPVRFFGDPFVATLVVVGALTLSLGDRLSGLTIIATVSVGSLLSLLRTHAATRQETELDQDIPRFGRFMGWGILVVTLVVLLVHVACHRPLLQALLFSFALAFGMAPKAMPAIIAVSQALATQQKTRKESAWRRFLSRGHFGASVSGGPSRSLHSTGK